MSNYVVSTYSTVVKVSQIKISRDISNSFLILLYIPVSSSLERATAGTALYVPFQMSVTYFSSIKSCTVLYSAVRTITGVTASTVIIFLKN